MLIVYHTLTALDSKLNWITLLPGEYSTEQLMAILGRNGAAHTIRSADGFNSMAVLSDGKTIPAFCYNPNYDVMLDLQRTLNAGFTQVEPGLWEAKQ